MYCGSEAYIPLANVQFTSNHAERGGGVALYGIKDAMFDECLFHGNSGTDGGGMSSFFVRGTMEINNCTFSNNFAGAISSQQ